MLVLERFSIHTSGYGVMEEMEWLLMGVILPALEILIFVATASPSLLRILSHRLPITTNINSRDDDAKRLDWWYKFFLIASVVWFFCSNVSAMLNLEMYELPTIISIYSNRMERSAKIDFFPIDGDTVKNSV